MTEKLFNYTLDGLVFSVRVFEDDGVIKAEVTVEEGYADFNAIYWGDDTPDNSDFDGFGGKDKSLNMNGAEGSTYDGNDVEWDGAAKLSSAGLGKEGEDKPSFLSAGESFTFDLGSSSDFDIEDIDYLGIRATSTSTDAGSIKTIAVPEESDDSGTDGDDFPAWGQDISNIIFVFEQSGGDVKPNPDGDGYYTVKLDNWSDVSDTPSNDLDDTIDDILAFLSDPNVDSFIFDDSTLLGVVIKGGQAQDTEFYSYGGHNTNGTDPDILPSDVGFVVPDDGDPLTIDFGNVDPTNAIDQSYEYTAYEAWLI